MPRTGSCLTDANFARSAAACAARRSASSRRSLSVASAGPCAASWPFALRLARRRTRLVDLVRARGGVGLVLQRTLPRRARETRRSRRCVQPRRRCPSSRRVALFLEGASAWSSVFLALSRSAGASCAAGPCGAGVVATRGHELVRGQGRRAANGGEDRSEDEARADGGMLIICCSVRLRAVRCIGGFDDLHRFGLGVLLRASASASSASALARRSMKSARRLSPSLIEVFADAISSSASLRLSCASVFLSAPSSRRYGARIRRRPASAWAPERMRRNRMPAT